MLRQAIRSILFLLHPVISISECIYTMLPYIPRYMFYTALITSEKYPIMLALVTYQIWYSCIYHLSCILCLFYILILLLHGWRDCCYRLMVIQIYPWYSTDCTVITAWIHLLDCLAMSSLRNTFSLFKAHILFSLSFVSPWQPLLPVIPRPLIELRLIW